VSFRVLNATDGLPQGLLQVDLVKSRSNIQRVEVLTKGIVWERPPAPSMASGAQAPTSTIVLRVESALERCPVIELKVDYSGGPPVVRGIRGAPSAARAMATPVGDELPETRIERRMARMLQIKDEDTRKYYRWFTLLEERSEEEVIAANRKNASPKAAAEFDVAAAITVLREDLKSLLQTRMDGARLNQEARVFFPESTPDVAARVIHIHELVFMNGLRASRRQDESDPKNGDPLAEITKAFVAFCQGDLRIEDRISDVNVEPDSAMMFLFAEYALTLLQVVEQYGAPGSTETLMDPKAQESAKRLFADRTVISTWKRLAASFVLGQRAYIRAYAPRRVAAPAAFDDYVRTNFDAAERLGATEIDALSRLYDGLSFDDRVAPMADPVVRNLLWRHSLNGCEAFPGILEEDLDEKLGPLALSSGAPASATMFLRAQRDAGPSIRRHVRHVVANIARGTRGVDSTDTMSKLQIDARRRAHLATMLAAFASTRGEGDDVSPSDLRIEADSTVDTIAMQLDELISARTDRLGRAAGMGR
jgi:hypothetical protein